MTGRDDRETQARNAAARVGKLAEEHGLMVAVAESATGGRMASRLAAVPSCSDWFAGAVVSYSTAVKYQMLGVPEGPVISEQAVRAMAEGVAEMMGSDVTIAISGAAGPREQEGNPPGTVWLNVLVDGEHHCELHHIDGDPEDVLVAVEVRSLQLVADLLDQ